MTDVPAQQPVPPTQTPPSGEPAPDQTLPGEFPDEEVDDEGNPVPPGQDPDKVRGKSGDARGKNKPEPR